LSGPHDHLRRDVGTVARYSVKLAYLLRSEYDACTLRRQPPAASRQPPAARARNRQILHEKDSRQEISEFPTH